MRVVAPFGVQNTSQADAAGAQANVTIDPATALSAPLLLKIYVPIPSRVMVVPIDMAPSIQ